MTSSLFLHNKAYTPQQLLQESAFEAATEQEQAVISFVRQWLSDQHEFRVHTSGSTGVPKPIVVSRNRMQASARLTLQALGITSGDGALLCIHANYIGGKMMLVRALEGNLPLVITEPSADPLQELPPHVQPLFAALVPLQLQAVLQNEKSLSVLHKMKAVIVGGAPVSPLLEQQVQAVQAPLYSTYGMTETVSHIALRRLNGQNRQDFFTTLPQIRLSLDPRGCLIIDGPVVEEPIITNDVVELLADNQFRWLGRADNIINSGGVKVQAERVEAVAEACLSQLQLLSRRMLAGGLADEKLGQKLVLLLEGEPLAASTEQQLLNCLLQELPKYWAPKHIFYLPKFVESSNGKIKRDQTWAKL